MLPPLNPKLSGLKFSKIFGTAYTSDELYRKPPVEGLVQLSEDQHSLSILSKKYDEHQNKYWGERGHYAKLGEMASKMGANLVKTGTTFFKLPTLEIPQNLLISPSQEEHIVQNNDQDEASPYEEIQG